MDVDFTTIHRLRDAKYHPNRHDPDATYLTEYQRKEFGSGDVAELFHENTKNDKKTAFKGNPSATLFVTDPTMEWVESSLPPDAPGGEPIPLPEPDALPDDLDGVLAARATDRSHGGGISRRTLSTLLGHAVGTSRERTPDDPDAPPVTRSFRPYPSGGALYPVELYLAVVTDGPDLDRGLYYYEPEPHVLRPMVVGDLGVETNELFVLDEQIFDPETTGVALFMTGAFWRSKAKYGPRGYTFTLLEAGHLAQNLLLAAEALDLAAIPLASYDDAAVNDLLGVNGVDEAAVYSLCVGRRTGA